MAFLQTNTPVQYCYLNLYCDQSSSEVHSKVVQNFNGLVSTAFPDPRQFVASSFRYERACGLSRGTLVLLLL